MKFDFDAKRFRFYVWVGIVFLMLWTLGSSVEYPETLSIRFFNNLWRAAYIVCANYLFFDHILPSISRRRVLRSLLLLVGQFLIYSFGLYLWRGIGILLHVWKPVIHHDTILEGVCYHFQYSILSMFFFGIATHFYNHRGLRITAQQLRIEKQEAELNYLKSQTNPHFLFNTLNNIYALSQDKSDLAPESILRLSKILRFMLYETNGNYIPLEQEIKVIKDYIALEKLRYDESLRVSFNYKVRNMQQPVPPLLLIPLVENAFKHGASETRNRPFVDIDLAVDRQRLIFSVKNSTEEQAQGHQIKENIGLSNLRRQLELLYTGYELRVQQTESVFTVTLEINLASHV
jgi:two-component system, LytTR family, sensor kinase